MSPPASGNPAILSSTPLESLDSGHRASGISPAQRAGMAEPPDLLNRVHQFALGALDFSRRLPNTPQARAAGDQFYRACASAEANYRAAQRGRSTPEFIAKLGIAVEGMNEAIGSLEHMRDGKMASDAGLLSEAEQLRTIFGRALGTARHIQKARERRSKDVRRSLDQ